MVSTELEVIEAEIVEDKVVEAPEPLSEAKAKALDKKIRAASVKVADNSATLLDLLEDAMKGQIHVALGYASWSAWCKEAAPVLPADPNERKAMVSLMSGNGVSQRIMAELLSVNQSTVSRDVKEIEGDAPASSVTVGSDEKVYPKKPKKEKQEPLDVEEAELPEEPRKATDVIDDFGENMDYLVPNVQAFTDIINVDSELFPKARKRIAQRYLNRLTTAISDLQKVVDELMEP